MKTEDILHILRNPYSWSRAERREAMVAAANEIEKWKVAFENLQDWCDQNGWDTTTRG